MNEHELIEALTTIKIEQVPAFQVATTPDQWEKLFTGKPTEQNVDEFYITNQHVFDKNTTTVVFPKCQQLTQFELFKAVKQATEGFEPESCKLLLESLKISRNKIALACTTYREIWNKQPPIDYVCGILEEKLNNQHIESDHDNECLIDTTNQVEQSIIDDQKLKLLFVPVFYSADDYIGLDQTNTTRYNDFVRRLNVLLNDKKTTDTTIGSIVVLLYKSQYKAQRYKTTLESKGKFAPLTKAFFEAINRKAPKYIRPNSYPPNDQILTMFGDVLRVKRNYKGEIEPN